jgi:hypothetical protein
LAQIHDLEIDDYLKDCTRIEPTALEEEFVRLPSDLAYWNERYSRAFKAFLCAKIDFERAEARAHIECRETLMIEAVGKAAEVTVSTTEEPKGKKAPVVKVKAPTVDDINAATMEHPDLVKAREALLNAEVEKVRLFGVLDAVRAKREMIVSLGAHIRAEMQGDPSLREQSLGARRAREG